MSLKEYVKKRAFDKTPEPKGDPVRNKTASGGSHFFIQRHDATRLHYDFRLEMDGVLKSWAVPKGPSLEPLSKHLAMHVEDHPLEYGTFEGNIPKGEYGGGSVMLWDRGTFELLGDTTADKQIERGDLKFRLDGEKLQGEFALVHMRGRGKGNEWLIIKKKDAEAKPGWNIEDFARSVLTGRTQQEIADNLPAIKAARIKRSTKTARKMPTGAVEASMPSALAPMMATLVDEPPTGDDWLYEVKWDGVRGLCFIKDKQVRILSRTGNRCEQQYPELSVLAHHLRGENAILDGEIAVVDAKGKATFSLIQPRIAVADPNSIAHLSRKTPVTLFLFDLLYLDGYDLRNCRLIDRKNLLAEVIESTEHIRLSGHFLAKGKEMLEAARQSGLEGIVAKRLNSKYESRRSRDWLKVKVVNEQEFVIGGFTHGERAYFSSLVLGLYQDGKLVHTGQVGTGFNDRSLAEIYKKLEPLITDKSPFANKPNRVLRKMTWVKPELVAQIKYLEFTPDGILRAPVFLGLRTDKNPKECVRELPAPIEPDLPARPEPPAQQKFNNLQKIFFPKDGVTKGDVIQYYDDVAEFILPHLEDRPLSLKRYPNGIHAQYFFQKNVADKKFPEWIRTEPIASESQDHLIHYVIANDKPTLLYLANLGCIDQNPWMSRVGSLDNPDFVLIDLDPYDCSYDQIVDAALLTRTALDEIGLEGYPKTTGGDGMHIYIPLEPIYTYDQVRSFAEVLWHLVVARQPDLFTTPRSVAHRKKGRVYFDYLQIGKSKTIAAPYVLRSHDGAPVATPLAWKEVKKGLTPGKFTIRNAVARFSKLGDLFGGVLTNKQRLEEPIQRL
ncbi:MAG: DNA ligase D, partial [Acidobacteriota bacterium]|nr:DNA ligase D [Acidobacteriota bacterium]